MIESEVWLKRCGRELLGGRKQAAGHHGRAALSLLAERLYSNTVTNTKFSFTRTLGEPSGLGHFKIQVTHWSLRHALVRHRVVYGSNVHAQYCNLNGEGALYTSQLFSS